MNHQQLHIQLQPQSNGTSGIYDMNLEHDVGGVGGGIGGGGVGIGGVGGVSDLGNLSPFICNLFVICFNHSFPPSISISDPNPIQNSGNGVFSNKLSRLTLATFDDEGRCIGQMGSLSISY